MASLRRRHFLAMAPSLYLQTRPAAGASSLDDTLREGIRLRRIPLVVGAVGTSGKTLYTGAFGKRDSASHINVTADSIFRIASMTKPVTTAAALQLVERGKLRVDDPVSKHMPGFDRLQLLEGFDPNTGKPRLRPARKPVLLRHLLTHTSGFVYDTWDGDLLRYVEKTPPAAAGAAPPLPPLLFEPGTRWEYGTSIDWTGKLVEKISGQTLEGYFQQHILGPLGMRDTSFILPESKFDRLVNTWQRQAGGALQENPRTNPSPPKSFNGGGGLYSTAPDYMSFMQMILRRGKGSDGQLILRPESVALMTSDQTGGLSSGKLKSFRADRSSDVDFHPGASDGFTFGFLINTKAYEGGRSAGSLAWAGLLNTFFWIDPRRDLAAVLLMQFLPFCDTEAVGLLRDFERAVYAQPQR